MVAAISSVIAWGRASFDNLNLIFNSPVTRREFWPYFSPAVINAQWTGEVPEPLQEFHTKTQRKTQRRKPLLFCAFESSFAPLCERLSTSLKVSGLSSSLTLQPHVGDGHAFLQRLAHVVNSQRGH